MPLPGFTAEASLGPTTQVYRTTFQAGLTDVAGTFPQWADQAVEDPDSEAAAEAADAFEMDDDVGDDALETDMTDDADDIGDDALDTDMTDDADDVAEDDISTD